MQQFHQTETQEQNVEKLSAGTGQKVPATSSTEPGAGELEQGHVTMDSSDSSEGEGQTLSPVVGHRPLHGRGTKWLFLRFERF